MELINLASEKLIPDHHFQFLFSQSLIHLFKIQRLITFDFCLLIKKDTCIYIYTNTYD